MQNKTLIAAARTILKNLLSQLEPGHLAFFKKIYSSKNQNATIEEVVEQMKPDNLDWAITQCENSIKKTNGN